MEALQPDTPIVILSMSRWDGDFSSASWSLAKAFALTNPVYYVDYPYTWLDVWRERKQERIRIRKPALLYQKKVVNHIPGESQNLKSITPPAMLPINWLPAGRIYERLLQRNNNKLFRCILKSLRSEGHSTCIFINSFNPLYAQRIPDYFPNEVFIYQSRDNIRALEAYLQKHGSYLEVRCIQNADLSLATSIQLTKDLTALSGRPVAYLPNAADIELFKTAFTKVLPKPQDLENIKGPIIGYTGNICHRLDYELILSIATSNPDKNIVMVGPLNFDGHTDIDLRGIKNLHFTGAKNIKDLPAYLQHFDVLILPFLKNELTRSIYPLKINEYLASGKPVVSTRFSEDIEAFNSVIELADSAAEFNQGIHNYILNTDSNQAHKRIEFASGNSWESRVRQLADLLQEIPKHKV